MKLEVSESAARVRIPLMVGICPLIVSVGTAIFVVGWLTGANRLSTFGLPVAPMAPSSAWGLLLLNLAILGRLFAPRSRAIRLLCMTLSTVVGAAAVWLLLRYVWPWIPGFEDRLVRQPSGFPLGLPVRTVVHAAATIVLIAAAVLVNCSSLGSSKARHLTSSILAHAVGISGTLGIASYAFGRYLVAEDIFAPMTLSTSVACFLTAVPLMPRGAFDLWLPEPSPASSSSSTPLRWSIPATMLLVVVGLGLIGALLVRREIFEVIEETERALLTLSELKAAELANWRTDRLADGAIIASTPVITAVLDAGQSADAMRRKTMAARRLLDAYRQQKHYTHVEFVDDSLRPVPGWGSARCPELGRAVAASRSAGAPVLTRIHPDQADGKPSIALVVPVSHTRNDGTTAAAYAVLHMDATQTVYAALQAMLGPHPSVDLVLLGREGTNARILTALKAPHTDLGQPAVPVERLQVLVRQAFAGRAGAGEGYDPRWVPVILATSPVAGAEWVVIARIDRRVALADVSRRVWSVSLSLVLLAGGLSLGLLVIRRQRDALIVVRELQERSRAERSIRLSEEKFALAFQASPYAIAIIRVKDGRLLDVNDAMVSMSGIPRDELVGTRASDLSVWVSTEELAAVVAAVRAGEAVNGREHRFRRRDGTMVLGLLSARLMVLDGALCVLASVEDVTEKKRTQDLLIQTEKMMSVGGLAAGMAHEINNPLGVIRQAIDNVERRLMADLPSNHDAAERAGTTLDVLRAYQRERDIPTFLCDIRHAAGRASRIVSNMLQFARRSDHNHEPVDLVAVLEQTVFLAATDETLRARCDLRRIAISRDYDADMPHVMASSIEVEQVLLNLLTNAGHAMATTAHERPPHLRLGVSREGGWAVVTVADNGPGIASEHVHHVFEPFFTTKAPGAGTGLGLSVAYALITQNHGGRIELRSEPGAGATFSVWLPLTRADRDPSVLPDGEVAHG